MKTSSTPISFTLSPVDNARLAGLCGQLDTNLRQIEGRLGVRIVSRGNHFSIAGDDDVAKVAEQVLRDLYAATEGNGVLTADTIHLALHQANDESDDENGLAIRTGKYQVRPQNVRQRLYVQNIRGHDINFGIGPAGTGKTYLAVACATHALSEDQVGRIVLVRPAVEAGERLGFLPGDVGQKVDPYLRPLYDALYELLGFDRVAKLMDRNMIELAPLAYMRGRTLNEAFVILDEAQNTTVEQMKMFLTRIGFGSKAVVTGDTTQTDLPRGCVSGLRHAIRILEGIDGISVTQFKPQDVVRHPLVQEIVEAYQAHADTTGGE